MKYPLIASKLMCEAWAILPEVHGVILEQFRAHALSDGEQGAGDPVGPVWVDGRGRRRFDHPQVEVDGDLALLRVEGIVGKHLSGLEMSCGGYCLANMEEQLRNVREDPDVRTLVIYFNTPGGTVTGVGSAAAEIRKVAGAGKRVVGFTDMRCCSAGYYLAAACDEFYAERSAMLGSISTFIAALDSSKAVAARGLQVKVFRTGEMKGIGTPGKAWTEEEETFMQEHVERCDQDFKAFVGSRRGLGADVMNGAFWPAAHAPEGVVDGVEFSSLVDVLEAVMV